METSRNHDEEANQQYATNRQKEDDGPGLRCHSRAY